MSAMILHMSPDDVRALAELHSDLVAEALSEALDQRDAKQADAEAEMFCYAPTNPRAPVEGIDQYEARSLDRLMRERTPGPLGSAV